MEDDDMEPFRKRISMEMVCTHAGKGLTGLKVGNTYTIFEEATYPDGTKKYGVDFDNGFVGWYPISYFEGSIFDSYFEMEESI